MSACLMFPSLPKRNLILDTLAFTACFACWVLYGVLVPYLQQKGAAWTDMQVGVVLALPVLVGSLARLPLGLLTDQFGGRRVFAWVLVVASLGLGLIAGRSMPVGGAEFLVTG